MEKMIDPNIIEYYIINCAIPSIIITTIEKFYQIAFGKPEPAIVNYLTAFKVCHFLFKKDSLRAPTIVCGA